MNKMIKSKYSLSKTPGESLIEKGGRWWYEERCILCAPSNPELVG